MRTTVTLDDKLVADAMSYTGIKERATLIRMGLESLVQREASRRLALMGGTEPDLQVPPRERGEEASQLPPSTAAQRKAAEQLALMGGTDPNATAGRRRRSS